MSLLVTGSIGIDTVETPTGGVHDALGGSSVYFAYAASFFTPVRLVGVVGDDCPEGFLKPLEDNPRIDLTGLEVRAGSKTFRWHGRYFDDVNERETVSVQLNVLDEAGAKIPAAFRDSRYIFLANTHPRRQLEMLDQLSRPKLVVADTMDIWIKSEREALEALFAKIDGLVLNDSEARLLTGKRNLIAAGLEIARSVRHYVVIKKGEHGGILFAEGRPYPFLGYPVAEVVDPTGAGDTFAGAMMGCLAAAESLDVPALRRAIAYGAVTASIELEDFSLGRLIASSRGDIEARMTRFRELAAF